MLQNRYYVIKKSNTYSDMLEAVGLSHFLYRLTDGEIKINLKDKGIYYELNLSQPITQEILSYAYYFDLFPYIKTKKDKLDFEINNFIDYEEEIRIQKEYSTILSNFKGNKNELNKKLQESGIKPRDDWSLIKSLNTLKALDTYQTLYMNIYQNKNNFQQIILLILELYSSPLLDEEIIAKRIKELERKKVLIGIAKVNSLQIVNPDKVKGANSSKSNSMKSGSLPAFWIREYLKIGGLYKSMVMKSIKVNSRTWDIKAYVFSINEIHINKLVVLYNAFLKSLKGITSIRLDIFSLLNLCILLINYSEEFYSSETSLFKKYNVKSFIHGFYVTYFKNMGNASSPTNISYLELPKFIEFNSKEEGNTWIEVLNEHKLIISNLKFKGSQQDENGIVQNLLQKYRLFLTTSDINTFLDFMLEYAVFLTQQIDKKNYYVKTFTTKNLEVFLMIVDKSYSFIINNQGFKNIAKAIRNSTISAQYSKSRNDNGIKYQIRYGLAQDIKRKAPYKDELIEYISDFITWYNSETARIAEKNPELAKQRKIRSTVKVQDIEEFITLLDDAKYDSNVIGKLLCAYGYSLDRKDKNVEMDENNEEGEDNYEN